MIIIVMDMEVYHSDVSSKNFLLCIGTTDTCSFDICGHTMALIPRQRYSIEAIPFCFALALGLFIDLAETFLENHYTLSLLLTHLLPLPPFTGNLQISLMLPWPHVHHSCFFSPFFFIGSFLNKFLTQLIPSLHLFLRGSRTSIYCIVPYCTCWPHNCLQSECFLQFCTQRNHLLP
jgi:hypothetical protein